jgi:hypothetical protein
MLEEAVDDETLQRALRDWPEKPREAAEMMIGKYGPPHEVTPTRLAWFGNGPWKRTVVNREEIPHNFPRPHTDILEQTIDYHVPPERFSALARFDGSVIAERTKGELTARCDEEPMNFLALNLAHDIAEGNTTVAQARRLYVEQATAAMMKNPAPLAERFQFRPARGDTGDADRPAPMGKAARAMGREVARAPSGRRGRRTREAMSKSAGAIRRSQAARARRSSY